MARATSKNIISKTTAKRRRPSSAKVDPIVALVANADRALEDYIKAANSLDAASAKLAPRDRLMPTVPPPGGLVVSQSPWRSDFLFTSEDHIDQQFRLVAKRLREEIAEIRRGRKRSSLTSEVKSLISRNQMVLAMLPKLKGPLLKEFRAERRRVLTVQQRVGLPERKIKSRKAWHLLHDLTAQIAKAKPATAAGALALVGYVGWRSWSEYQDFFSENGNIPGHFAEVLRAAGQRLERSIAA